MKRGINKTPDDIKTDEQYKKMLLSELEKEYEQEQKDFEQTAQEVQKRETAFAQSSTITRPNQRIVKLATQKRQPIQRQPKPEMAQKWSVPKNEINNNTPSSNQRGTPPSSNQSIPPSTQRGQGFKRFAKW